jgi:hypothetical protein
VTPCLGQRAGVQLAVGASCGLPAILNCQLCMHCRMHSVAGSLTVGLCGTQRLMRTERGLLWCHIGHSQGSSTAHCVSLGSVLACARPCARLPVPCLTRSRVRSNT